MGAIDFACKAFRLEMKGVPFLQFSGWRRDESSLEVVSIEVGIAALKEFLHGFLPSLFSEYPSVYLLEAVVLVDCVTLFVAVLAKVEVFAVFAVVPYIENGLNVTVVALIIGKNVARLTNLFSEVFLRGIGESFTFDRFGNEMT